MKKVKITKAKPWNVKKHEHYIWGKEKIFDSISVYTCDDADTVYLRPLFGRDYILCLSLVAFVYPVVVIIALIDLSIAVLKLTYKGIKFGFNKIFHIVM